MSTRSRRKYEVNYATEFELDLAPLLSVMVKLVPVLLIASSFAQLSIIETELPQVVQQAIQDQDVKHLSISMKVTNNRDITILINENGKTSQVVVPSVNKAVDHEGLNSKLTEIKKKYESVFKIDMIPENQVTYEELVKVMDSSRKSHDRELRFKVFDKAKNQETSTDYMFPEVVFGNSVEG